MEKKISVGDSIKGLTAINQEGNEIKFDDYLGQWIVLYFYPKDDTPGCTRQACNIRDNYDELLKKGVNIFGVSPDSPKKHMKFKEKYDLPFPLIADEDKKLMEAFGVWGEKKFMGITFEGVRRYTFVIDQEGIIRAMLDRVVTKDHVSQVMTVIRELEK